MANHEEPTLFAAKLASAGAGLAFALAAIPGCFVNYGIAIGFGVAALFCFVASHNFPALEKLHCRAPFIGTSTKQRTPWRVFHLIVYASLGIAIVFSILIGGSFYIYERLNLTVPVVSTARLKLHYTQNPITSEVTQKDNIGTFYTFAFLQDGTAVRGPSASIKWSDLVIVFDLPTTATHLQVRFDSGATLIYHPAIIGPRLAIINFEGSLAEKALDIEFTTP